MASPGSMVSFFSPRITAIPSTASIPQELHFWSGQATRAINALPPFSQFSYTTPESNVTDIPRTLGLNLAPASVASTLWLKKTGSGNTGWVAIA